ncbi:MAG: DNA primase [Propylenella sp.]
MRFPPAFLDDIRARIPISDVVSRRVSWDKRKSNPGRGDYWACCPFHSEKTPSFHAENRKGRYHCFGCGASGDHFTFLVEREGLSFPEAVEQLAAEAGIPMPARDPEAEKREEERASLHEVMERAARFFEAALHGPEGGKARAYLRERAISPEMQKRFRIGYAPASRNALKEHLANAGIAQEQMIEAGLLIAGEDIPVSFDRFRERVMFPITDFRGQIIAFGGRALSPDAQAKYLNSPETPLFQKGRVLFNAQAARAASRRGGHVVAVEGYTDVIACVAAGFEATVAPLGTALTEDQLHLLWQMADEPILCFDGDEAGLKAAFRIADLALPHLQPGKSIRFALLPGEQDPDDLIRREGPEPFRRILAAAKPLIDMLWMSAGFGVDLATPERRAAFERSLRSAVASIGNPDVRRHYDIAVRERLERHFGAKRLPDRREPAQWRAGRRPPRFAPTPSGPSASLLAHPLVRESGRGAGPNRSEVILIGVLVQHPGIAVDRLEMFAEAQFSGRGLAGLAAAVAAKLAESPGIPAADLHAALERDGHGEALAAVLEKLRSIGLGSLADADEERAAAVWDDAAHLRLRAGALSIERQAAAAAFAQEANEINLSRLRDIQEQDQRSLRPDRHEEAEAAIVHPFKRR